MSISRRHFFGGITAALGAIRFAPTLGAFRQASTRPALMTPPPPAEYDAYVKLAANENNYGPPEGVLKAMNDAWKYSNRYGYPDGNIVQEIAKHHGVKTENILLTAGSGELLDVVGTTFL